MEIVFRCGQAVIAAVKHVCVPTCLSVAGTLCFCPACLQRHGVQPLIKRAAGRKVLHNAGRPCDGHIGQNLPL